MRLGKPQPNREAVTTGQRIRNARLARGLRLIDVGMSLDICYQQVQAWESGRRNPGTKYLVRLAELLGLELADLIPRGPCATVC